ncbi:hypothetical protein D9M73_297250 [compost metagenome]
MGRQFDRQFAGTRQAEQPTDILAQAAVENALADDRAVLVMGEFVRIHASSQRRSLRTASKCPCSAASSGAIRRSTPR